MDTERNTSTEKTSAKITHGKTAGEWSVGQFPRQLVMEIALFISKDSKIKWLMNYFI